MTLLRRVCRVLGVLADTNKGHIRFKLTLNYCFESDSITTHMYEYVERNSEKWRV